MILTNGSVMFICVKLPVLGNAPPCALPKILQVNKPLRATRELNLTLPSLAVYFLYFTYLQSFLCHASFFLIFTYCVCTVPHSYIHTFIHPVMFLWSTISKKQSREWVVLWLNEWFVHPSPFCSVREEKACRSTDSRPISTCHAELELHRNTNV